MAVLSDAEQRQLFEWAQNAERGVTALVTLADKVQFPNTWLPNQQPSPNPLVTLLNAVKAIPAGGAPTQDQVDAAVAKVMNDTQWLAKLGAALASHIKVS